MPSEFLEEVSQSTHVSENNNVEIIQSNGVLESSTGRSIQIIQELRNICDKAQLIIEDILEKLKKLQSEMAHPRGSAVKEHNHPAPQFRYNTRSSVKKKQSVKSLEETV